MTPPIVTQHQLDVAGEAVERAHMKRGKAQRRATASTAQASEDAQDLQACIDIVAKAETELANLTDQFHSQRKGARIAAESTPGAPLLEKDEVGDAERDDLSLFDKPAAQPVAAA